MIKICSVCKEAKDLKDFSKHRRDRFQSRCKQCASKLNKIWRQENPDRVKKTYKNWSEKNRDCVRKHQLKKYGLSNDDYNKMFEVQNGKCAICNKTSEKKLSVDHCHDSGKIRGLLCDRCNHGLGNFKENINFMFKAIEYLECHRKV